MRRYLIFHLTLGVLFGLLLAGCGGGGGGGGGPETTVSGTVLDSRNADRPVAGATVAIGSASTTTDAEGKFLLRGAPIGATTAIVTPPGGEPQTIAFSPPIAAGPNGRFDLIINIGQLRGRVLDPQGQPAGNALVTVVSTGDNVTTGPDGLFQVDNIPTNAPGETTEVTAVLGTASVSRSVTVGNGVTDVGDLTLVDDPNPNPPGGPATIVGTVTQSTGGPAAGATIILRQGSVERERTTTDANGNYGFYVPIGSYAVRAVKAGFQDAEVGATVTNPSQPVRADIVLQP